MVTVMTLDGKNVDFMLIPIGSDSPRAFATRLDMDRIQALDQALDELSEWREKCQVDRPMTKANRATFIASSRDKSSRSNDRTLSDSHLTKRARSLGWQ